MSSKGEERLEATGRLVKRHDKGLMPLEVVTKSHKIALLGLLSIARTLQWHVLLIQQAIHGFFVRIIDDSAGENLFAILAPVD